jgi:hypothetical protein
LQLEPAAIVRIHHQHGLINNRIASWPVPTVSMMT